MRHPAVEGDYSFHASSAQLLALRLFYCCNPEVNNAQQYNRRVCPVLHAVGALIAQNRWLQGLKTQVASKEVWFWLHIAIQAIGAALIIAAIGIAYRCGLRMRLCCGVLFSATW